MHTTGPNQRMKSDKGMDSVKIILPQGTMEKLESIRKDAGLQDYGETLALLVRTYREHVNE